jgi:bifunctional non-homologous end joining protein LigD
LSRPRASTGFTRSKFDGYRTVVVVEGGEARAFTRNRLDWSDPNQPIVETAGKLRCDQLVRRHAAVEADDGGGPSVVPNDSGRAIYFVNSSTFRPVAE